MKNPIFIIFIVILSFSCSNYDKEKWSIHNGKGIENGSFDLLKFKTDSIGYLGGGISYTEFDDNGKLISNSDSTALYKTNNGGKNWKKINLNQEGEIRDIKFFGDKSYALNQSLYTNSKIVVSEKEDNEWKQIVEFEEGDYVRDYEYLDSNGLFVVISNNSKVSLLKVTNRIDTIKTYSSQNYKVQVKDGKMYMIYNSGGAYSDGVILYDYLLNKETTIPFDKNYWIYSTFINEKNEFFIAVSDKENETSKIFKMSNKNLTEISLNQYQKYSLGQIFVRDSLIFIDSNKPENVGPIGVTHELLYSTNGGVDWEIENYPFSLIVKPAFLKKNGKYIAYQGMKKFQEINTFANNVYK
ncbi:hypothetical protein NLM59_11455 [Weeksellaceae bacterium KMM 9724]|uniref:hypothetical protein n=1 Tax=Profundicola chukchiensis TaxID=2961959 RepID=UPI00243D97E9|nr:hypothetical protein [Profundicola chukchiensis]MDG4951539.1 hypothetical protein [Profundicola chukchiensis]